ncbi:hypothetical protein FISHEDRAFT_72018 [Fistulina hepatica ATCC 64428]|uniref:Uncharacterized protein n=1 Tax=Fistulina hepatica ATCC 64428 TaxID=1128425 RepID=A0A0D7AGZ7_9AGAR|nr:hypothetical protein FISHEDRAFT_72018 [Fistulina hepatica ATCC 64428]
MVYYNSSLISRYHLRTKERLLGKNKQRTPESLKKCRCYIKRNPTEKAALKQARQARNETYNSAMAEARDQVFQIAMELRERLGQEHTVQYYIQELCQLTQRAKAHRNVNKWNSFLSQETQRLNQERGERKTAAQRCSEIKGVWNAMSQEEKDAAVVTALPALEEKRAVRKYAKQNVSINAYQDVRSNFDALASDLDKLAERTGAQSILVVVWSDPADMNCPMVHGTSEKTQNFFLLTVNKTVEDFARRFEGYILSGVDGMVKTVQQEHMDKKKRLPHCAWISEAAAGKTVSRMVYMNFDEKITCTYSVVIEGWPLPKFCGPHAIDDKHQLNILCEAFGPHTTRFRRLTPAERIEWEQGRIASVSHAGGTTRSCGVTVGGFSTENSVSSTSQSTPAPCMTPLPSDVLDRSAGLPTFDVDLIDPVLRNMQAVMPTQVHNSGTAANSSAAIGSASNNAGGMPIGGMYEFALNVAPYPADVAIGTGTTDGAATYNMPMVPFSDVGTMMSIPKKKRKERSDKGKPRGPQKKRRVDNTVDIGSANGGSPSTAVSGATSAAGGATLAVGRATAAAGGAMAAAGGATSAAGGATLAAGGATSAAGGATSAAGQVMLAALQTSSAT